LKRINLHGQHDTEKHVYISILQAEFKPAVPDQMNVRPQGTLYSSVHGMAPLKTDIGYIRAVLKWILGAPDCGDMAQIRVQWRAFL